MQGYLSRRFMAVLALACVATAVPAGEIVSTMRNVSAVAESQGFRLNAAHDIQIPPMASDLSPAQAFEVLHPSGKPVTIGRLFTSCSCIQLESPKRTYGPNERVILTLRNIKPTPDAGQVYAVFVQITSPVRATLRFDTFVQSGMANGMPYQNPLRPGSQNQNSNPQNQDQQAQSTPSAEQQQQADRPAYRGTAHASALAALTRQIDEGLTRPIEASEVEEPDVAVASRMAPPAAAEEEEAVAEAREVAALRLPATAVQSLAARSETATAEEDDEIIEADETVAPLQPPPGVAVIPGRVVQPEAETGGSNLPPLPSLADTFAAGSGGASPSDFDEDDVDIDDFNPLLNPPAAARTNARATRPPVQRQPLPSGIAMDDFDRVLDGVSEDDDVAIGGISDQEILEKERKRLEEMDLGTADWMADFDETAAIRNAPAIPPPAAALPPVTVAETDVDLPAAPAVAPLAATPPAAEASVAASAPQSGSSSLYLDEIAPSATTTLDSWIREREAIDKGADEEDFEDSPAEELRAAADSLPPPPGLTTPGEVPPLTVSEITASGATALPPIALEAVTPPAAVEPLPGVAFEAGTPEPRPVRDPSAPKPVQAVSLITVGVSDLPSSIRFYEALGWRRAGRGKYDQTAFFQLQGQILALYPLQDLLVEQNMPNASPTPGGITLALHVQDRADVWSVYQRFLDAGGKSLRQPAEMASGAVTSYVADPDGNAWEISWVPQFRIDEEGGLWLP